ncbi:MAG: hypothetical protein ACQESB_05880 [Elusimicrobiota bacterium]
MFENREPERKKSKNEEIKMWDLEGFVSWWTFDRKVRVVRTVETHTVCRQKTGQKEKEKKHSEKYFSELIRAELDYQADCCQRCPP